MTDERHFLAFVEGQVEVLEEFGVSGGVLERNVSEFDVALNAGFEEFGVFSDLDLVFVFGINNFEETCGCLFGSSNVGEEVRVVSYSHGTEYNGVDGGEDIWNGDVLIVSDKDSSEEEDEGENDEHDHLGDSVKNSRNVSFFDTELERLFKQIWVFVEDDIFISEWHHGSDVYHSFGNEAWWVFVSSIRLTAKT